MLMMIKTTPGRSGDVPSYTHCRGKLFLCLVTSEILCVVEAEIPEAAEHEGGGGKATAQLHSSSWCGLCPKHNPPPKIDPIACRAPPPNPEPQRSQHVSLIPPHRTLNRPSPVPAWAPSPRRARDLKSPGAEPPLANDSHWPGGLTAVFRLRCGLSPASASAPLQGTQPAAGWRRPRSLLFAPLPPPTSPRHRAVGARDSTTRCLRWLTEPAKCCTDYTPMSARAKASRTLRLRCLGAICRRRPGGLQTARLRQSHSR
jgi:hypothetical protein